MLTHIICGRNIIFTCFYVMISPVFVVYITYFTVFKYYRLVYFCQTSFLQIYNFRERIFRVFRIFNCHLSMIRLQIVLICFFRHNCYCTINNITILINQREITCSLVRNDIKSIGLHIPSNIFICRYWLIL
jgi:hypothetical protein